MNKNANTTVSFRYNSISAAAYNHDEDAVEVAVSIEIPAILEGEPDPAAAGFFDTGLHAAPADDDDDFVEPQGLWIATGKTAFQKTGGEPGVPIAHYIDANSIDGLVAPSEIIAETKPEALADLARCWAEGIGNEARQIWIDREGRIRERINF